MPKDDAMQRVIELLINLVENVSVEQDTFDQIADELWTIYSDETFRHSYAELSDEMGHLKPDQRDLLCLYVDEILCKMSAQDVNGKTAIKFSKLCDHINLEHIRIARIERVEYIGQQSSNDLTAAGNDLEQTRTLVKELSEDVKGFHTQSITILGIFAGLVISFAAFTQFTTISIANLTSVNVYQIILFLAVAFTLLFNIIFFMMYSLSKISGKSIAANCEKRQCSSCGQCTKLRVRVIKKYPYFVIGNIGAFIICAIAYYLNIR